MYCESSSVGRASAFQAEGREFESRLSLKIKAIHFMNGFFYTLLFTQHKLIRTKKVGEYYMKYSPTLNLIHYLIYLF
jgi:hypothetical protein